MPHCANRFAAIFFGRNSSDRGVLTVGSSKLVGGPVGFSRRDFGHPVTGGDSTRRGRVKARAKLGVLSPLQGSTGGWYSVK